MSSQPLNPAAMFNKAIQDRDSEGAWAWARQMGGSLSLDRALSLTIVLGIDGSPRYEPAALKFLTLYFGTGAGLHDGYETVHSLDTLRWADDPTSPLQQGAIKQLWALVEELAKA